MRKGIKFSLGAALAGVALATCPVQAAELGDTVTTIEPAVALIMPFDVTDGRASFELVSRIGGEDSDPIATHWSFWSESCDHLADVFICLTPRDSVVVDPTALHAEVQVGNENQQVGPLIDLSGKRGLVVVTAYQTDTGSNGKGCHVQDNATPLNDVITGSWTIANTKTSTGYGADAIGFTTTGVLPDPAD